MIVETIYIGIALVVGIIKWNRAVTPVERVVAIIGAILWPFVYLTQELTNTRGVWLMENKKGDKQ